MVPCQERSDCEVEYNQSANWVSMVISRPSSTFLSVGQLNKLKTIPIVKDTHYKAKTHLFNCNSTGKWRNKTTENENKQTNTISYEI